MGNRVGIIGVTETKCEEMNRRESTYDLVFRVTSQALKDAGIEQSDIDTVVMAESDQIDGRVIGAMAMALTFPPCFSLSRRLSSRAWVSKGFMMKGTPVLMSVPVLGSTFT